MPAGTGAADRPLAASAHSRRTGGRWFSSGSGRSRGGAGAAGHGPGGSYTAVGACSRRGSVSRRPGDSGGAFLPHLTKSCGSGAVSGGRDSLSPLSDHWAPALFPESPGSCSQCPPLVQSPGVAAAAPAGPGPGTKLRRIRSAKCGRGGPPGIRSGDSLRRLRRTVSGGVHLPAGRGRSPAPSAGADSGRSPEAGTGLVGAVRRAVSCPGALRLRPGGGSGRSGHR